MRKGSRGIPLLLLGHWPSSDLLRRNLWHPDQKGGSGPCGPLLGADGPPCRDQHPSHLTDDKTEAENG